MKQFLRLKHWQLFSLVIGIPVLAQFALMGSLMTSQSAQVAMVAFSVLMLLFMGLLFSWLYTLGTHLYGRLPAAARMSVTRFRIALFLPVAYISLLLLFMGWVFTTGSDPGVGIVAVILPLHLLSMVCMFYCLYFIAKALKSVEVQQPVSVSDYLGDFFLLWFYPIGIWILQPRVNKLFQPETTEALTQYTQE